MEINKEQEKELINEAKQGNLDGILSYVEVEIDTLSNNFAETDRGLMLEIPVTSLKKAAESHLLTAVLKYSDLIDSDSEVAEKGFVKFFSWFAEQGINEYAHKWEALLSGGNHTGPCCGH